VIGLEKIREESLYPLKQGLIGSSVKPEPSLKQCTSLLLITCGHIIKIAIITDMRSPDVIFGKAEKIFLPIIIKLTLKEKQAVRTPQCKAGVKGHHDTLQNFNPILGKTTKVRIQSLGRTRAEFLNSTS